MADTYSVPPRSLTDASDPTALVRKSQLDAAVDLAEAKLDAPIAYTAAVAADALLGKTTRFDTTTAAIAQPLPAAISGRRLRIGFDAGGYGLSLAAATGDVIGAGSAAAIPVPSTRSIVELRCTVTGRWRVVGGYTEQDSLDARFARSAVPAAAGTRAGFYDPARSLYTPKGVSALRRLRALSAQASTGGLVEIVCGGDSRTTGYTLGTPSSWPALMRARLAAIGATSAGTGLVMAANGTSPVDSRIVQTGTWQANPPHRQWGSTGATLTFTSDSAGTVAEVYYFANSGTFTVAIDGGTAVTVTPAGGTTIARYQVTGLSNATHTIKVTTTSAAGYFVGFQVRQTTGLVVHGIGVSGWTSSQWASTGVATLQQLVSFLNPAGFGLMIGCNDPANSITAATSAANLSTILSTNNPNPAKFLIVETPVSPYAADQWAAYVSTQYDAADSLGLPLLDLNDRWGGSVAGSAAGLLGSDNTHETLAGHHEVARCVAGLLAA